MSFTHILCFHYDVGSDETTVVSDLYNLLTSFKGSPA